jgi:hypothetical protein
MTAAFISGSGSTSPIIQWFPVWTSILVLIYPIFIIVLIIVNCCKRRELAQSAEGTSGEVGELPVGNDLEGQLPQHTTYLVCLVVCAWFCCVSCSRRDRQGGQTLDEIVIELEEAARVASMSAGADPPPQYDLAVTMPRPRYGDLVRFKGDDPTRML